MNRPSVPPSFSGGRDGEAAFRLPLVPQTYERYLTTPFFARTIVGFIAVFGSDPYWLPVVYERLGDLYEQRSDSAKAIRYYGKLVALWEDADPELQPRVEAARRAVERLAPDE